MISNEFEGLQSEYQNYKMQGDDKIVNYENKITLLSTEVLHSFIVKSFIEISFGLQTNIFSETKLFSFSNN